MASLKTLVAQKIMNEVIRATAKEHNKELGRTEWRVLIVDNQTVRMLSACTKMHELTAEGITIVETIEKRREPLAAMEAIYLITPSEKSIRGLINDFQSQSRNQYRAAHVYLTEACKDSLFKELAQSSAVEKIRTLREINMSFLPFERQVFLLDKPSEYQVFYDQKVPSTRSPEMEQLAEQLATLCCSLGEYPTIRYRADYERNLEFAQLVQQKLDAYKADEPAMCEKTKSVLLILDRGFDTVSPLLHELTLQAMAHDLLQIEGNVFRYTNSEKEDKEVLLDEHDDLWVEMRHQHIAVVMDNVNKKIKKFSQEKITKGKDNLRDLAQLVKKMPQHKKEYAQVCTHFHLAELLNEKYKGHVDKLCKVEQDLAMGTDEDNKKISDHMRKIMPVLLDDSLTLEDKIRIILLYIQSKNGITEENLTKLVQHSQIPNEERDMITNLSLLGCDVVVEGANKKPSWQTRRKDRSNDQPFVTSRWTPVLKDIIEDCIDEKLDRDHFPFLIGQNGGAQLSSGATSSGRYGGWHSKDKSNQKNVPRVIVYVIGGITHSESRVGYEVTNDKKGLAKSKGNWEILVGGSQILTPETFLQQVKNLSAMN